MRGLVHRPPILPARGTYETETSTVRSIDDRLKWSGAGDYVLRGTASCAMVCMLAAPWGEAVVHYRRHWIAT